MVGITGEWRFRVHSPLFGKQIVVLQVEVNTTHWSNSGGMVESEDIKIWRDATPEEAMEIYRKMKGSDDGK